MKLVRGFGINDLDYSPYLRDFEILDGKKKFKIIWTCPFYSRWSDMLERCFCPKAKIKAPGYLEAVVSSQWKSASAFRDWMRGQHWEGGMHLDKDILVPGNKVYGPDTCVFVPQEINKLLLTREKDRGEYPLGVHYQRPDKKMISERTKPYLARACNFTKESKDKYVGYFSTPFAAHAAWQMRKSQIILDAVHWWEFDPKVCHTFNSAAAQALLDRASKLVSDSMQGIETKTL